MKNVNTSVMFILSLLLLNSNVFAMKRIKRLLPSKPSQKAYGSSNYRPTFKERLSTTPGMKKIFGPSKQVHKPTGQQPSITKFFSKDKFGQKYQSWAGKQKLGFNRQVTPDQISQKGKLSVEERVTAFPKQMQEQYPTQATGIAFGTMGLGNQTLKITPLKALSIKEGKAGKVDPALKKKREKAGKTYEDAKQREAAFLNPAIKEIKIQEGSLPPVPTATKPILKRQYKPLKHTTPTKQLPALPIIQQQQHIVIQPTHAPVKINLLGN